MHAWPRHWLIIRLGCRGLVARQDRHARILLSLSSQYCPYVISTRGSYEVAFKATSEARYYVGTLSFVHSLCESPVRSATAGQLAMNRLHLNAQSDHCLQGWRESSACSCSIFLGVSKGPVAHCAHNALPATNCYHSLVVYNSPRYHR